MTPRRHRISLADRLADFLANNFAASRTLIHASVSGTRSAIDAELRDNDRFMKVPARAVAKAAGTSYWARTVDFEAWLRGGQRALEESQRLRENELRPATGTFPKGGREPQHIDGQLSLLEDGGIA